MDQRQKDQQSLRTQVAKHHTHWNSRTARFGCYPDSQSTCWQKRQNLWGVLGIWCQLRKKQDMAPNYALASWLQIIHQLKWSTKTNAGHKNSHLQNSQKMLPSLSHALKTSPLLFVLHLWQNDKSLTWHTFFGTIRTLLTSLLLPFLAFVHLLTCPSIGSH